MKKFKLFLISITSTLIMVSCMVDDDRPFLEEANATTPFVVGFQKSNQTANVLITGNIETFNLPVDLFGGGEFTQTPEFNVTFEIDPSSTAIEGTHYDIISGNSIIIPENRDFGNIEFNFDTSNLDSADPRTVVINLLTTSNGVIAEQFKQITLTIQGVCVSDYAGIYTCPENISSTAPFVTITEIGPSQYRMDAMPYLAFGGAGGAPAYIEFSEVCGTVQWSGDWAGGTLAEGDGSIDPTTGVITFNYLRIYNGDIADPNDIWFDLGSSTFTPN